MYDESDFADALDDCGPSAKERSVPTVLRIDGFEFFFYANEHLPRHVHVKKGNEYGKVDLESMRLVSSTFKAGDERKMMDLARLNRATMVEAWDEYFRPR